MDFTFNINSRGYIRQRENIDLEFKESFHKESVLFYLRSIIGMANNKGGQILFGIKNHPHIPCGMINDKFLNIDPKEVTEQLRSYFSHEVEWGMEVIEFNSLQFGQFWVNEATEKPVMCKKNHDKHKLREGAIYYRYRGETREISYTELSTLINKEKAKEQKLWMEHIQRISAIGPKNTHIIDSYKGDVVIGENKLLIDQQLLKKIKFIKEGHFVENNGAPALVLKGEISGLVDSNQVIASDNIYPLFSADLQEKLSLNNHQIQCVIWKLKIKGDKRYHTSFKTGKQSNETHKYSEKLVPVIKRLLNKDDFLSNCKKEYKQSNDSKKTKMLIEN